MDRSGGDAGLTFEAAFRDKSRRRRSRAWRSDVLQRAAIALFLGILIGAGLWLATRGIG